MPAVNQQGIKIMSLEKSEIRLISRFFEGDKEPKDEAKRQLAHLQENLADAKKLVIDNEEALGLITAATERATAILMHLDRLK